MTVRYDNETGWLPRPGEGDGVTALLAPRWSAASWGSATGQRTYQRSKWIYFFPLKTSLLKSEGTDDMFRD